MRKAQPCARPSTLLRASATVMCVFLWISLTARAQRFDLAVTYTEQYSLKADSRQNFWMQGGSAELGADLWRGWGLATNLTGTHAGSIDSSGVPLSLVTATIGPRYRWHGHRKVSLYGQGLFGGARGFKSLFPDTPGPRSSASSLAVQLGGGVDYRLTPRFGLRLIDADWVRTALPNASENVQKNLRLGTGLTLRF